jgi:hypothetical protein
METQTEVVKHDTGKGNAPPLSAKKPRCQLGTLERLSASMRRLTQHVAATRQTLLIYDNINMVWKVAEQVIGRTGESSTSITITAC